MQKLAEICVRRPVFATMLVAAITVVGGVSFFTLGVDRYPRVETPVVSVTTSNPGATPESIETEITDRIEAAVNTVAGIDELRSTSSEGQSRVTITFDLSKNPDVAAQEVRAKVDPVIRDLPETADPPVVQKQDPDSQPIMSFCDLGADAVGRADDLRRAEHPEAASNRSTASARCSSTARGAARSRSRSIRIG